MRWVAALVLVAGCVEEPGAPVFTGTPRRYVVDDIIVPRNNKDARAYGLDLNGDGTVDNQLGMVSGTLDQYEDITHHGSDMIAAGVIASSVIVRADDELNDSTVALNYLGYDGAAATHVGGSFDGGAFSSGSTAEKSEPGTAIVRVPFIADADPADLPLIGVRVQLLRDGDGYTGVIGGALPDPLVFDLAYAGIAQMLAAHVDAHRYFLGILDANHDYQVTRDEFATNSLVVSLLAPDVTIDGTTALSFGMGFHLSPCEGGDCALSVPADACYDRAVDGTESDVDCGGGSCRACTAGRACRDAADCESAACDAGHCRAPQCNDGVRDGLETDVDCGGPCGGCALGARCWSGADCASLQCGEPCAENDFSCYGTGFDTCHQPPPP